MKKSLFPALPFARAAKQLVGFSRREMRGFGVLLAGLGLLVALPALVSQWLLAPAEPQAAATENVRSLDQIAANLEQAEQTQRRARYANSNSSRWGGASGGSERSGSRSWAGGAGRGATTATAWRNGPKRPSRFSKI